MIENKFNNISLIVIEKIKQDLNAIFQWVAQLVQACVLIMGA
jgi:hypothetical protein